MEAAIERRGKILRDSRVRRYWITDYEEWKQLERKKF